VVILLNGIVLLGCFLNVIRVCSAMRFLFDLVDQVGKRAPFLELEDDILKRE
jgi:hypothetical protein